MDFWLNEIKHYILPIFQFCFIISLGIMIFGTIISLKWSALNISNENSKRLCVLNITSGCFSAYANHKIEIRFICLNQTHIRHLSQFSFNPNSKIYWTPLRINHEIYSTWWLIIVGAVGVILLNESFTQRNEHQFKRNHQIDLCVSCFKRNRWVRSISWFS